AMRGNFFIYQFSGMPNGQAELVGYWGVSCNALQTSYSILPNGLRIANHFGTRAEKAEYLQDCSQNPLNPEGSIGCLNRHKWCLTATVSCRRGLGIYAALLSRAVSRTPRIVRRKHEDTPFGRTRGDGGNFICRSSAEPERERKLEWREKR